jgi:very-short-patch-repair endonuclease
MQRIPPELTDSARALRNAATPAERLLWRAIRDRRPRFTRQFVVGNFIVDFACRSLRLAVELDGGHHSDQVEKDDARTRSLGEHGWTVIRFWNNEVYDNLAGVIAAIDTAVASASTHPLPLPCREGRSS